MKRVLGIIPARYDSSRFPGKPLAEIEGKPMIQWVYERSRPVFDHLFIATDDYRILNAAAKFEGEAVLTSPDHRSGTDRCYEAYTLIKKQLDSEFDIIINIQGDEPLINPSQLEELISVFEEDKIEIATLIKAVGENENIESRDLVKVVVDKAFRALYFSRLPIPFSRESSTLPTHYKHIGLYGYSRQALQKISLLAPTMLEQSESLEQLRWLENGFSIQTKRTEIETIGVDSPEDIDKVLNQLRRS